MSKRQSDYLSALLSPSETTSASETISADAPLPSPTVASKPTGNATLLARESALARVASGEVSQVTQVKLDPRRVRVWSGNARTQGALSEASCRDLIDAIISEGGQKVPAIVRRVTGDPNHDYEVIAGSRRLWAIGWLRSNNYPDMTFLAQVHNLDDEAAFRLSDIENRARKDVSDFERARAYLAALSLHYGGKQARMAERLRLSKGWLSKMLSVAALPDWAVNAFASLADIQLKAAYPLAQKLANANGESLSLIKDTAKFLAKEQKALRALGNDGFPADQVIKLLLEADQVPQRASKPRDYLTASGRPALSVMSANRNGVSLRLHAGSGASEDELLRLFQNALADLKGEGRGVG